MTKIKKLLLITLSMLLLISMSVLAQTSDTSFSGGINEVIATIDKNNLDEIEKEGLFLMREEEKLARDVYLNLYEKWDLKTFYNIAQSEKTHLEAIKLLLDRYDLKDPIGKDIIGVFENEKLQELYNELVTQGGESLEQALKVGALIEELDIYDLKELLSKTDNDDIKIVYLNLLKGSRNHLRSFDTQLN
ncbi:unnamed protein product, partial [marine sediment metagenome]